MVSFLPQFVPVDGNALTIDVTAKAKRLLQTNRRAAAEENLRIPKPPGQVDREYHLHEAMSGGQLDISTEAYRKFLVSILNC